jgi:hypothetical protein
MLAGAIEMTLGLQANQFLQALGMANSSVLSLFGTTQLLQSGFQKVWGAIEKGGALLDLSNRTGDAVGSLYQLQQAFTVAGVGAESVGSVIRKFNMALAGSSEEGENVSAAFKKLGLDPQALSKMGSSEALVKTIDALSKFDKISQTSLSNTIFSRQGGAIMNQIARDAEGFKKTIQETAESAKVWERVALAFDEIGDTVELIKGKISTMWAGIAEGAIPMFNRVLSYINSIDWVGIGRNIGKYLMAFEGAAKSGQLGELIELSLIVAFENAFMFAARQAFVLGEILKAVASDMFKPLVANTGALAINEIGMLEAKAKRSSFLQQAEYDISRDPNLSDRAKAFQMAKMREQADIDFRNATSGNNATARQLLKEREDAIKNGIKSVIDTAKSAIGVSGEMFPMGGENTNKLKSLVNMLSVFDSSISSGKQTPIADMFGAGGSIGTPQVSALEKIGLIFGGGGTVDYTKDTAKNTKETAMWIRKTHDLMQVRDYSGHV